MTEDVPSSEEIEEEEAETDPEQAESEWHAWVAGIVIVGGVGLLVIPNDVLPDIFVIIGPLLVVLGVVGWAIQWYIKRSE